MNLINEDDFNPAAAIATSSKAAASNVAGKIGLEEDLTQLSARERARLKRKAKRQAKGKTVIASSSSSADAVPAPALIRPLESRADRIQSLGGDLQQLVNVGEMITSSSKDVEESAGKIVVESSKESQIWQDLDEWPFEAFCEMLSIDLFEYVVAV